MLKEYNEMKEVIKNLKTQKKKNKKKKKQKVKIKMLQEHKKEE